MRSQTPTLLFALLISFQSLTSVGVSPVRAQATQVIAVQDITATADCTITWKRFHDDRWNDLRASRTYPCPPGSVFHSFVTTEAEAIAAGLSHVPFTGNLAIDDAAVTAVQAEQLTVDSWDVVDADVPHCRPNSYTKSMTYHTGAYRSRIKTKLYYYRDIDQCHRYRYAKVQDTLIETSQSICCITWRQSKSNRRGVDAGAETWWIGCKRLHNNDPKTFNYQPDWSRPSGWWFGDETMGMVNDEPIGPECNWGQGQSYVDWMYI